MSFCFAFLLGTVVASFRVSPVPPLRVVGAFYTEIFRNTPLAVLMVLFFFGLTKVGIQYDPFPSAVIVLSIYTSTYLAEAIRSGINAVPAGQAEAARSLGLGFGSTLSLVILPQAFRTVVSPIGSQFIALVKNSAIALVVGVMELTNATDTLANNTARNLPVFAGAAIAYLIITYPAGMLLGVVERRLAIKR